MSSLWGLWFPPLCWQRGPGSCKGWGWWLGLLRPVVLETEADSGGFSSQTQHISLLAESSA